MEKYSKEFEFAVDRGGTFTDFYCVIHNKDGSFQVDQMKLLSEDPSYTDSISEGIKIMVNKHLNQAIEGKIPCEVIRELRIGTTIGTNALLEKKGSNCALIVTKGFKDLLKIGNQSRPDIFKLDFVQNDPLSQNIIEVDERITVTSDYENNCDRGDNYQIEKPIDKKSVLKKVQELKKNGIESIAISLMNSYMFEEHENIVEEICQKEGFEFVSSSHKVSKGRGYVSRTSTTLLDAYLNPVLRKYLDQLKSNFDEGILNIYFMRSDGVLVDSNCFTGSGSILSGPAGGVTGFIKSTVSNNIPTDKLIGFDMGGTSTDVSLFDGHFELNYESEIADVFISQPHLDINTVAAGGGSRLFYRNSMIEVGPESAGSHPGPVCYGKDGYLTVTDCNLKVGRLSTNDFPKIFGPNQNEGLYSERSSIELKEFVKEIKKEDPIIENSSDVEIAYGFIKVANEMMCKPIRSLTQGKGKDPKNFTLSVFGGAGSQHACEVANNLGITNIFIHKYSSILSAFGIFLADISSKDSIYFDMNINLIDHTKIHNFIKNSIQSGVEYFRTKLEYQNIIHLVSYVMKYEGSEARITINQNTNGEESHFDGENLSKEFKIKHKEIYGFNIDGKNIMIESVYLETKLKRTEIEQYLKYERKSDTNIPKIYSKQLPFYDKETSQVSVFDTPVYSSQNIKQGEDIKGPVLINIEGSTIVVEPYWKVRLNENSDFELTKELNQENNKEEGADTIVKDPIMLSIFGQRFMSIAEQMGRLLQRTAISTNIKERLDFSCAVFGPNGDLVANAPHLPVHLGSMENTVKYQIENHLNEMEDGDVIITNHPVAGGSHLPDVTAITPCFYEGKPIFYVASRGHHSEIGGIMPGSMPAFSKSLNEEGVAIKSFFVVKKGKFREEDFVHLLKHPGNDIIGSRNPTNNIGDIKAQVASNNKGIQLLNDMVDEYGLSMVQIYMNFIQDTAEESVRNMLRTIVRDSGNPMDQLFEVDSIDYMDDESQIQLKMTINPQEGTAIFDFEGTSNEVDANFNTPVSVVKSALIYCLRCLVNSKIPLNAGCMRPVQLKIPPQSLLNPSETSAIVGGNVTTSQRITDVILKAFQACADSQGCMNNVTFGNDKFGYYETIAGGAGAGPDWVGQDCVHTHMTNTRITDPEVLEARFPVILRQFSERNESGGSGKNRGGNGVVREYQFKENLEISLLTERRVKEPEGIQGGSNGLSGVNMFKESGKK